MRSLTSYLITIFSYMFWILRIGITLLTSLKVEVPIKIVNLNYEIIFLFITLVVLLLVTKRKTIGGILYFSLYLIYFGNEIYHFISQNMIEEYFTIFIGSIGIIISFISMVDLLLNRNRGNSNSKTVKKTDWFYKNKQFDREMDERSDKNNYRLM